MTNEVEDEDISFVKLKRSFKAFLKVKRKCLLWVLNHKMDVHVKKNVKRILEKIYKYARDLAQKWKKILFYSSQNQKAWFESKWFKSRSKNQEKWLPLFESTHFMIWVTLFGLTKPLIWIRIKGKKTQNLLYVFNLNQTSLIRIIDWCD